MQIFRLLAAFLVGPFVGPAIGALVGNFVSGLSESLVSLYFFVYTSIGIVRYFAWILTLALMIPAYFLMRRRGWLDWWQIILAWAVAQSLPMIVVAALLPDSSIFILTGFVEGALDGLGFRLIAGAPWPRQTP
ncbi:MAG: hypothetical protein ACHQK9_18660 [Reyranellales bacterium]